MNVCMFNAKEWDRPLAPGDYRAEHIRSVLGLSAGDSLKVGLIGVGIGEARLLSTPPGKDIELKFPSRESLNRGILGSVHLIIGHPRPPVFQRLLKDLSSMGIEAISWVRSELCEKSYLSSRVWDADALEKQIRLGLEQGAVCRPPRIGKYYSLKKSLDEIDAPAGAASTGRERAAAFTGNGSDDSTAAAGRELRLLFHADPDAPDLLTRLSGLMVSGPSVQSDAADAGQGSHDVASPAAGHGANHSVAAFAVHGTDESTAAEAATSAGRERVAAFAVHGTDESAAADKDRESDSRTAAVSTAESGAGRESPHQHPLLIQVAIGPERGWTHGELSMLRERGFETVQLGPGVLRTENAAVIAAGICNLTSVTGAAGQEELR